MCMCGTCFGSVVAVIQHQTVHTFKFPVLGLSIPQCRNQNSVLGPVDESGLEREGEKLGNIIKLGLA